MLTKVADLLGAVASSATGRCGLALLCVGVLAFSPAVRATPPQLQVIDRDLGGVGEEVPWAEHGYVERHYFMSGLADVLEASSMADSMHGHLDRDNAADLAARPAVVGKTLRSGRPYTTRVVVVQPQSADSFSGVVVLEPLHPRGRPTARDRLLPYLLAAGHAWVGVENPITFRKLRREHPDAFAGLAAEHPSQIWGMLTHSAQAIRNAKLISMPVRRIVMTGYSNSGTVTALFANSFGDRKEHGETLIDGYLPLASGVYNQPISVPVIRVMTQSDFAHFGAIANRRDDGDAPMDRYRLIEVSGSTHSQRAGELCALYSMPENAVENDVPLEMVMGQALSNLIDWIDAGIAPPRAPRMQFRDSRVVIDEFGHALGGLRLPQVEVPLSKLNTTAPGCDLAGFRVPLSPEKLRQMYSTAEDFVARREAVIEQLASERWISALDAQRLRTEALQSSLMIKH